VASSSSSAVALVALGAAEDAVSGAAGAAAASGRHGPPDAAQSRAALRTRGGISMSSSEREVHGAESQQARAPSVVNSRVGRKCSSDQNSTLLSMSLTLIAACDASAGGSDGSRRRTRARSGGLLPSPWSMPADVGANPTDESSWQPSSSACRARASSAPPDRRSGSWRTACQSSSEATRLRRPLPSGGSLRCDIRAAKAPAGHRRRLPTGADGVLAKARSSKQQADELDDDEEDAGATRLRVEHSMVSSGAETTRSPSSLSSSIDVMQAARGAGRRISGRRIGKGEKTPQVCVHVHSLRESVCLKHRGYNTSFLVKQEFGVLATGAPKPIFSHWSCLSGPSPSWSACARWSALHHAARNPHAHHAAISH
jgi:hypothetical protein